MSKATLSVVVPNYNDGSTLVGSLEAILAQSRAADEVLVVDDGSTDNSVELVEKICRANPSVRLIKSDRNCGLPAALNRGLKEAGSDYVCFPAADDRVLPGFFEQSMAMLESHPEAGLSCCTSAWRETINDGLWQESRKTIPAPAYLEPEEVARLERSKRFLICDCSVIVKRSALLEIGGFDTALLWSGCWFAYVAIGFRHGLCYLPDRALVAVNRNPTSYSGVGARDEEASRQVARRMLETLRSPEFSDVAPLFRKTGILCAPSGRTMFLTDPGARAFLSLAGFRLIIRKEAGLFLRRRIPLAFAVLAAYRKRYVRRPVQAAAPWRTDSI